MAQFPIIAKLGGRDAVFGRLSEKGLVKTHHAMRMWGSRGRGVIPGDCARELMRMADEKGVAYTAADFEQAEDEAAAPASAAE
jgi:hypothetical protein